jgi:hypothetical protein
MLLPQATFMLSGVWHILVFWYTCSGGARVQVALVPLLPHAG